MKGQIPITRDLNISNFVLLSLENAICEYGGELHPLWHKSEALRVRRPIATPEQKENTTQLCRLKTSKTNPPTKGPVV